MINEYPDLLQNEHPDIIAPGEGHTPISLHNEDNWDVMAFPHLHPSGTCGYNTTRDVKISMQKYFIQRILNVDPRFSNCLPYVFAALNAIERHQLQSAINISVQRAKMDNKKYLNNAEDYFRKDSSLMKYFKKAKFKKFILFFFNFFM